MRLTAPGSTLWLLAHETRLTLREMAGKAKIGRRRLVFAILFFGFLALCVGIPLGLLSRKFQLTPDAITVGLLGAGLFVAFTLMLAQTLSAATMALYQRGDLDLLLSSPLDPRRTLAVRLASLAGATVWLMLMLAAPVIIPAALLGGHWKWLSLFPVLIATALLASATGSALSMALFAVLGARRTRTVAQILGALIGAAVFMTTQLQAILGDEDRAAWVIVADWSQAHDLSAHPVASLPARAALGEPLALAAVILFALTVFVITALFLGARFAHAASVATGAMPTTSKTSGAKPVRFGGGPFRRLVGKELTLILRDPALISQVLLQLLYLAAAAFVVVRAAMRPDDTELAIALGAGSVVFLAGQIAAGLGWITVSGEDAPQLMQSAPLSRGRIGQAKATAVMILVVSLLAIPLGLLIGLAPLAGLTAAAGAAVCAGSMALVEFWLARPGRRSDFRHRQAGGGLVVTLSELVLCILFATTTTFAIMLYWWAVFPAAAALGLLAWLAAKGRKNA